MIESEWKIKFQAILIINWTKFEKFFKVSKKNPNHLKRTLSVFFNQICFRYIYTFVYILLLPKKIE